MVFDGFMRSTTGFHVVLEGARLPGVTGHRGRTGLLPLDELGRRRGVRESVRREGRFGVTPAEVDAIPPRFRLGFGVVFHDQTKNQARRAEEMAQYSRKERFRLRIFFNQ